jgi:hypothetical protein
MKTVIYQYLFEYLEDRAGADVEKGINGVGNIVKSIRAGEVDTGRLDEPADNGKHGDTAVLELGLAKELNVVVVREADGVELSISLYLGNIHMQHIRVETKRIRRSSRNHPLSYIFTYDHAVKVLRLLQKWNRSGHSLLRHGKGG